MNWQEGLNSRETFPVIISRMAKAEPDRPFANTTAGLSASWSELYDGVRAWADRFVSLGVCKGDYVVTMLDSDLESLQLWLGLASIGAIDATVNTQFRGRLLAHAINTCRPALIVVAQQYLPNLEAVSEELEPVAQVLVAGCHNELDNSHSKLPRLTAIDLLEYERGASGPFLYTPQWYDIACVSFTSGTTGPSKAVLLPWGQLHCNNLGTFPFEDLSASDIFYCVTSHAHFGSKAIPYMAAMAGGQVVIRPKFSLNCFWEDIERFGVTSVMLVGTMAEMLIQSSERPPAKTSLHNVFMTPLGRSHRIFSAAFGVRICTVYSSTENSIPICSGWNPANASTCGRLRAGYPGFEVRLVDENDLEVEDGTPGECIVRSAVPWTMNAGYLNNPEATAAAWRNGFCGRPFGCKQ